MGGGILITGARGWLASSLVASLERDGVDGVTALDRKALDCTHTEQIDAMLGKIGPRTIVHLAASLARGSEREITDTQWRDTFLAGRNVVQAAPRFGVRHLVLVGTMEELGDQSGALTTDLPARPRTTYGLCKSLVREVAQFEARHAPSMRVDWVRPTTIYGPGQRGAMLVPFACASAKLGRPAPFTSGTQKRDFLYVDDLVDWIRLAVDERVAVKGAAGWHLHHLGTGDGVAVREVLQLIADELPGARFAIGALVRREHEPPIQVAPPYVSADPVLSSWTPMTTWHEGIKRTIEWWRSQGSETAAESLGSLR